MFTKNDKVTLIRAWDNYKGSVYVRHAIVESCGKKKMTLRAIDGEMLGRNFLPTREQYSDGFVVMTEEYSTELALEFSTKMIAKQHAHCDIRIADMQASEAYRNAIRKDKAEILAEPLIHSVK